MTKLIFTLIILLLTSCNYLVNNTLQNANVNKTNFIEEIDFNFDNGLPLVTVNIKGQEYIFLLDTGAPTVISPKIANLLQLQSLANSKVEDSQGNVKKQNFVTIKNLKIGNLNFENIGAVVFDVQQNATMKCLKYDGIVGANLMSKAIWEIDYQSKKIRITDAKEKLEISKNAIYLNFITKAQKTPLVSIKIGKKTEQKVIFDTGANISFNLSATGFVNEIKNQKTIQQIGKSAIGIYGNSSKNKTLYSKVQNLNIGNLRVQNQIVRFNENGTNVIGNDFLKHFKVVLNWNESKIYLANVSELKNNTLTNYGLTATYNVNKFLVSSVYLNSEADKKGIKLGDEIIEINGFSLKNLNEEQICNFTLNGIFGNTEVANLKILMNNVILNIDLKKSILLE
ncbi:aspartyl protease family protein [Flavobacterium sp. XS1P32]|uniref:aspartyl protease family protein n=1 Tax=unclassified Flavobacterium TaxID=196869 RepID=UPI003AB0A491